MKAPGIETRKLLCIGGLLVALASPAVARPVPQNLVNGLDKIVEYRLSQKMAAQNARLKGGRGAAVASAQTSALAREATAYTNLAIIDGITGKYLVEIMPDGKVPVATLQPALLASFPALQVTAVDTKYAGHGVIEGYINVDDAAGIAAFNGVGTVILQLRPVHNVGSVTEFGVNQHRVNRVNKLYNAASVLDYEGQGMSIGVMSDSYDSQPTNMAEGSYTTASQDVASGDLPGIATATPTAPNTQPVVVLDDFTPTTGAPATGATNEGRGMCQIVADMAPLARIAFATADRGELGFANNIRALGALTGYTIPATQAGFKADVICDDVSYLDEPMFQDGIVAQGVIDVVNAGITYCSSAANNWGTDGYDSDFRPVANGTGLTSATNSALVGTNINLTGVDPSLYAGGFHNFNPNGLDVAQTFNTASDPQGAVFQWNDPYDVSAPTLGAQLYSGGATSTGGQATTFGPFSFTQGQEYVIVEKADTSLPAYNFDGVIDIYDANGNNVTHQDTGTDETVYFFAPSTGSFTVKVSPYVTPNPAGTGPGVPTMGPFTLTINTANGIPRITQDFNLLFFRVDTGAFISAVATNNIANNRPYELFVPTFSADGYSQVQLVIARSNTTAPANAANHFKYVFFGNGLTGVGPAEYNNYLTPVTFGHSAVAGANSIAAYSCFRPNLPEDFTSPGPVTIYFDTNNNRLATPQIRRKPDIAAADGSNNTFFPLGPAQDVPFDADTNFANFYGTSAASPHAAAIAALVIQSHGGPGKLTPAQVKTIMQLNTFPHDLDPYASNGTATTTNGGTVTVGVVSDNDPNTGTGSMDPNSWSVAYTGPGYLRTLSFNPDGTAATGGNPTGGSFTGNAAGSTTADFLNSTYYKSTPGMVFNSNGFLNTGTSTGLIPTDATATFTNAAPLPSTSAYYWTLNLLFGNNNFTTGKLFHFNVTRNQQQDAQVPQGMTIPSALYGQTGEYSADILGDGVMIPEYADTKTVLPGMTFSGTVVNGATTYPFSGRLTNKIGQGYSTLDGYGFVNVEAAVSAALPTPGVVSRKVHGTAGTFDLPLPLTGTPATECRVPDANNGYQLVYTFAEAVSTVGTPTITQGTATVASTTIGPAANQVTVNLTGVTNAQRMIVTLSGVLGNSGTTLGVLAANVNILVGDVNGSGATDSGDVTLVRVKTISLVDQTNFLYDVNLSGTIDSGDVVVTRSYSITALP